MKFASLFLGLVCLCWCAEAEEKRKAPPQHIPILKKEMKVVGEEKDKNYRYLIHTANGIYQEEQGILKNAGESGYEAQLQQGQYQYVSPEGKVIQLSYTADEHGFVPKGDHIPTPPPVPIEIQKLLEVLATKKPDPADRAYDDPAYVDY